jgi:hypothetical protein
MATRNKTEADKATAEVAEKVDAIEEKGYIGSVPDPNPNLAYSPQTGPDAPALAPDDRTRSDQPAANKES